MFGFLLTPLHLCRPLGLSDIRGQKDLGGARGLVTYEDNNDKGNKI